MERVDESRLRHAYVEVEPNVRLHYVELGEGPRPVRNCTECLGTALPERPLEARLLAQRLVPAPARWAPLRERAGVATRHARQAHRRAEIEESL